MNIIKSEFYKLGKSKPFWICAFVCAAIAVFFAFVVQMGIAAGPRGGVPAIAESMSVVGFLEESFGLTFLPTIFAVFVSLFVSGEFHSGAMKNCVSKGFNRVQIYLSKLAVCGAAVLAMYIVNIAVSCAVGTILWDFDPSGTATVSNVTVMLLGEGLLQLAYCSVFVLISMWLRGVGASIAVNICTVSLLPTMLMAVNYLVNTDLTLANYWISGNVSTIASLAPESGAVLNAVIAGLCYLVVGTVVGSALFKKQDIK